MSHSLPFIALLGMLVTSALPGCWPLALPPLLPTLLATGLGDSGAASLWGCSLAPCCAVQATGACSLACAPLSASALPWLPSTKHLAAALQLWLALPPWLQHQGHLCSVRHPAAAAGHHWPQCGASVRSHPAQGGGREELGCSAATSVLALGKMKCEVCLCMDSGCARQAALAEQVQASCALCHHSILPAPPPSRPPIPCHWRLSHPSCNPAGLPRGGGTAI